MLRISSRELVIKGIDAGTLSYFGHLQKYSLKLN